MSDNFSRLVKIMEQLRGEQGCPWDKEQTRDSIKPFLVEEVYEVLEAIEQADPIKVREELGDLLLQIVFQCQIAKERHEFEAEDVLTSCIEKIVRRHPHVFGDQKVKDAREVLHRWEELKRQERGSESASGGQESLLEGLPKTLPALILSHRVQERVSRIGFDWPSPSSSALGIEGIGGVLDKVREEFEELAEAIRQNEKERIGQELGDLLFSLVNLARFTQVDPEGALRETTRRFIDRFKEMDRIARAQGRPLHELTLEEMDALWEQSKNKEKG
ncbi:MAG: nucleoside triphosphate pyrophosphohydrolase [Nitrospiria bacterium]